MKSLTINILFTFLTIMGLYSCASDDDQESEVPQTPEQYGSPFVNMPNREDAIIYQVNLRAFSEEGTLNGVRERLEYIKSLGVNTIYLMPIYPVGELFSVGGLGSPYSIRNYKEVSTEYGSMDDLRKLVEEAHAMDMAVILDWVANHTSFDNDWITEHPEWYSKNEEGEIISPSGTNFNDVAQLDFDNLEMREAMKEAMSFWVYNANIDGFRCDFADGVQRSFWAETIPLIRKIKNQNMLMLAEGIRRDHFDAGFDYTFGFRYFDALKKVFSENEPTTSLQNENAIEYENVNNSDDRVVRYTTNHDVNFTDGTPIELFGGKQGSLAAFVTAAYMESVPMIYNAQEIGYEQQIPFFIKEPIDWSTTDTDILAAYKEIIAFRKDSEALKTGTYKGYSSNAIVAFTMQSANETVFVLSNLTNTNINYIIPASLAKQSWNNAFTGESVTVGTELNFTSYQYIVLKK